MIGKQNTVIVAPRPRSRGPGGHLVRSTPHGHHGHVKRSTGTVADVKNNLSRYLAYVRRGGRVLIYNRDTPVAELVPPPATGEGTTGEDLARLEREGVLRRGSGRLSPELLRPPRGRPAGVLEALLEERAAGR
jgi:antitoxin (DNA-binding transcriptional repressor) of toxin-antitoxin stability system